MTTLHKSRAAMPARPVAGCHDGVGEIDWVGVLGGEDLAGRHLRFFHDDVLPPGTSIGIHRHSDDEEYYYILSGQGVMTLDGKRHQVAPGDITAVFPGGEHGLENTGDTDLRVLVISAS
ncbi:MAG: cupin domain-containing protein [Victivallales bacterium]|jgi:quercetin dioxygenase-like cupin family protein|nr:cupin domain-containing protein [Victivallales bacterium]